MYTDTPLLENTVNGTQLSGIQASTNVNGNVYGRIRRNSQKTVISVNGQKALKNIGKMLVKEILLGQLSSNAEKVNDYAVYRSVMMSPQLEGEVFITIRRKVAVST